MKSLFKNFSLFILILTIAACGKEPTEKSATDDIVGEWQLVSLEYDGNTTVSQYGIELITEFDGLSKDEDLIFEFKDDGTYEMNGSYTITLNSTIVGFPSTSQDVPFNGTGSGDYSINDSTIDIGNASFVGNVDTSSESTQTFNIDLLTSDAFEFSIASPIVTSVPGGSSTIATYKAVLTK